MKLKDIKAGKYKGLGYKWIAKNIAANWLLFIVLLLNILLFPIRLTAELLEIVLGHADRFVTKLHRRARSIKHKLYLIYLQKKQ